MGVILIFTVMAFAVHGIFIFGWDFMFNATFFINSILLGIALAMDAFSVSMANAMIENKMKAGRMSFIAFIYAFFQFIMPFIGWIVVHTATEYFKRFQIAIPFIALALLGYIGGKMLIEGIKGGNDDTESIKKLTFSVLIVQGIATSIDALSTGFAIEDYNLLMAFTASLIIATVTFIICIIGLIIGKKFGDIFKNKASILGGVILIGIGIEIFVKGVLF